MRLRRPPTPREARPSTPTIGDVKTQTALEQGESSSLYEFSHPTHDKATPLSIAVEILKAINQAADIFPPLKTVTGAALYIAQTAESFHTNKADWTRLSSHIKIYTATTMKFMQEDYSTQLDDCKDHLIALNGALTKILDKITILQRESCAKKLWRQLKTHGQTVQELQREFDDAIRQCSFQISLLTDKEILKNLRQGDSTKIIGALLQKFKDDIETEINRIASIQRLPDPTGASWDPHNVCLIGTRAAHRREIHAWIIDSAKRSTPQLFLIADAMGSGKTTLANSICQQAKQEHWLVACFFFSRLKPEKSTPRHLFASVIRGLCHVNKGTRDAIAKILQDDPNLPVASPTRQFQEVILPICPLLPTGFPLVIVIDALDEGYDEELLRILRDGTPLLPSNLCIVVTTRPEDEIMSWLERCPHVQRSSLSLVRGRDTQLDIARYVQDRLQRPQLQDTIFSPKLIKEFVDRSEGVFLWADVILGYLKGPLRRDKALEDIIATKPGSRKYPNAEAKIDALYDQILSSFQWEDENLVQAFRDFLGALVASRGPMSMKSMTALYAHETTVDPESISEMAKRLRSLLNDFEPQERDRPIRLLHFSVREYLTSRVPPSKPYHLDIEKCHRRMAQLTLATIDNELTAEVPILGFTARDWDMFDIPRVPKLPSGIISDQLSYSCRYFVDHTMLSGDTEDLLLLSSLKGILSRHTRSLLELSASMGSTADVGGLLSWIRVTFATVYEDLFEVLEPQVGSDLWRIGVCLRSSGQYNEALIASQAATDIYRRVTSKDGAKRYQLSLARSLNSLGVCLGDFRRDPEAIIMYEEAISILSDPDEQDAESHRLLARVLNNLSMRMNAGQQEEALRSSERALEIYRNLSKEHPGRYEPHVGWGLLSRTSRLANVGRDEEALKEIQDAVGIYRKLAERDHGAYDGMLAYALHTLSIRLDESGKAPSESLIPLQEAADIYRRLVGNDPGPFQDNAFAACLDTLSTRFLQMNRYEDALGAIQESVEIYRRINEKEHGFRRVELADGLYRRGRILSLMKKWEEALLAVNEAVELYRSLQKAESLSYELELAASTYFQTGFLNELGRYEEAIGPVQESIEIYQKLHREQPMEFITELGRALDFLATFYDRLGRYDEALKPGLEAVELYRQGVTLDLSASPREDLARGLYGLAVSYGRVERTTEASAAIGEAVEIYRALAGDESDKYEEKLADSLRHFCYRLSQVKRDKNEDAVAAIKESVDIYRRLVKRDPEAFLEPFRIALYDLYACLKSAEDHGDEAEEVFQEFLALCSPVQF